MTSRAGMIAVIGFVIGSILSVLVVQYYAPDASTKNTMPPDPLVVAPENAAEETR
ncbi:hypothetical protein [Pararhizobium sp. A13]|uniref:hypothetical protein n=1 Tax=Pararhizobium sp. A13 TaxID=3133975 RepID=UPI0032481015